MVISTKFPRRRPSPTGQSNGHVTKPAIRLSILGPRRLFNPGDEIECEYEIIAANRESIPAIEASILWYTEGKGEEDMAIHFFERRVPGETPDNDLRSSHRFRTKLPNCPLSYHGEILQIRWCVRIRVFLEGNGKINQDLPFQLGVIPQRRRRKS